MLNIFGERIEKRFVGFENTFLTHFVLDGNTLTTMQNARALHRMMNILKQMEPLNARG